MGFLLGLFYFALFYVAVAAILAKTCNARMGVTIHWGALIFVALLLKLGVLSFGCASAKTKKVVGHA